MAWISVHERIIGGKLRTLARELKVSQNEAIGILIRLWLWGLNNTDRDGKIISAGKDDIAEILSIGLAPKKDPEEVVEKLIETGWIDAVEGELYIHDWEEQREYWFKYQDKKAKDAERKRIERAAKKALQENQPSQVENKEEKEPDPINPIPPPPKIEPKSKYESNFEEFWKEYPRKEGKGEAYKKYKARLKDGFSEHELLCAAKNYAYICKKNKTEQKYIKHGKTFLSDTTPFIDYLPKKKEVETHEVNTGANPFR